MCNIISDEMNLKFRISSPEQSEKLQKVLFSLGYKWCDNSKECYETDAPFLYTDEDKIISWCNNVEYFNSHSNKELNTDEFIAQHTKKEENMNKRHKWADVIIAAANGEDVQWYSDGWVDYTGKEAMLRFAWYECEEYRIKPKQVEKWLFAYLKADKLAYDVRVSSLYFDSEEAFRERYDTTKFQWVERIDASRIVVDE